MFRHGVASGDPLADRVVIWTRVTGDESSAAVEWEVARDEKMTEVVTSGSTTTDAEVDFTVQVDVHGLEPGTRYWYRFRSEGVDSPIGRTRTLPERGHEHVKFAMVSCAKFNAGFFNAYARIAERDDLDFLLHLGDYIYEASNAPPASQTPGADIGRPFDPLHECVTLDDYRRRYSQYRLDPDVQRLHAAHPMIATLDDHEFADGAWRDGASEHRESEYGPWATRRAAAFRVRWEWIPARRPDPDDPERVWRTVPVGTLADLLLLDTRTQRDEPSPVIDGPERTALGAGQRAWLFRELAASRATWRLIANPSVMAHTWTPALPDDVRPALHKVKLVSADQSGPDFDQWDGYPAERTALLDHLEQWRIEDVVVLSGDVHVSLAIELNQYPFETDEPVAVEFVAPSLTSQNLDDKMHWGLRTESVAIEQRLLDVLPHWKWCDLDSHGYVIIDLTTARLRAEWWFVPTVLEPAPDEHLGAAFEVPRGRPRVTPG